MTLDCVQRLFTSVFSALGRSLSVVQGAASAFWLCLIGRCRTFQDVLGALTPRLNLFIPPLLRRIEFSCIYVALAAGPTFDWRAPAVGSSADSLPCSERVNALCVRAWRMYHLNARPVQSAIDFSLPPKIIHEMPDGRFLALLDWHC